MDFSRTQIELFICICICLILILVLLVMYAKNSEKARRIMILEGKLKEPGKNDFELKTIVLQPDQFLEIVADHAGFLFTASVEKFGPEVELRRLFEKTIRGDSEAESLGQTVCIGNERTIFYHRYWTCTVPTILNFAFRKDTVDFYVDNIKWMPGYRG